MNGSRCPLSKLNRAVWLKHRWRRRSGHLATLFAPIPTRFPIDICLATLPAYLLGVVVLFVRPILAAVITLLVLLAPAAAQEKRIALLIGNRNYDASVGALKNPHNDISVVGAALKRQGFEVLPEVKDGTRLDILAAIREFARLLHGAGPNAIGFLYYSGHGAAEKDANVNYVIPVDAREPGTARFWDASLKLDDILRMLDVARAAAKFIVFDACRNELQLPTKDTTKGLIPISDQQGMLVAYASAPGKTASDFGDNSGPYAAALAAELARPGLDHLNLFQNVREAVLAKTGGLQQPWESNGLSRRVFITGAVQASAASAGVPQPALSEAAQAWSATQNSTSIAVLEAFARRYTGTIFTDMAEARIRELRAAQILKIAPPTKSPQAEVDADHELTRSIQSELRRLGCYSGPVDGRWGPASQAALIRSGGGGGPPSKAILARLMSSSTQVCRGAVSGADAAPIAKETPTARRSCLSYDECVKRCTPTEAIALNCNLYCGGTQWPGKAWANMICKQ